MTQSYDKLLPALKHHLPENVLCEVGRAVGFIQRLRTIGASAFVWSVVLSRFRSGIPGFDEARRAFKFLTDSNIYPRPFQIRFKSAKAVALMESAFQHAVAPWKRDRQVDHPLSDHFSDIVAIDSTYVKLHDDLRSKFKGLRNIPSQMKVILAASVFGLVPLAARLLSGSINDSQVFFDLSTFRKGSLLLFDTPFGVLARLKQLNYFGLSYLVPMRRTGHATIVGIRQAPAKVRKALAKNPEGVELREFLSSTKNVRKPWDLDVLMTSIARGKHTSQRMRLVIVPDKKKSRARYYLTNIGSNWSPAAIVELYRLRWQIELVFKELKQDLALEATPSKDENAVQVFVWASLIALAVSRTVATCFRPLKRLCGLTSELRPSVLTRQLRAHILVLASLLAGKLPIRAIKGFADALYYSSCRLGRPPDDSLKRLRRLTPAA